MQTEVHISFVIYLLPKCRYKYGTVLQNLDNISSSKSLIIDRSSVPPQQSTPNIYLFDDLGFCYFAVWILDVCVMHPISYSHCFKIFLLAYLVGVLLIPSKSQHLRNLNGRSDQPKTIYH